MKEYNVKSITGKPRLPRASRDTSLEDAFVGQIALGTSEIRNTTVIPFYEREYFFAQRETPPRQWRFDFAWPALKIAVEIEGGTNLWRRYKTCGGEILSIPSGGRHQSAEGFEADAEKYNTAESTGWHVLRLTSAQVHDGRGLAWLAKLIKLKTKGAE